MKNLFLFILLASSLNALSQCEASFVYQYHNEVAKGGTFKLVCGEYNIDATASSGFLGAANNPYYQLMKNAGPIPSGTWEIYAIKNEQKAILRLRPTDDVVIPTDSNGKPYRDGFLIHGLGETETPDQASTGCIILDPPSRKKLLNAFKVNGTIKLKITNIVTGNEVN